jgi:hypothetical protein
MRLARENVLKAGTTLIRGFRRFESSAVEPEYETPRDIRRAP